MAKEVSQSTLLVEPETLPSPIRRMKRGGKFLEFFREIFRGNFVDFWGLFMIKNWIWLNSVNNINVVKFRQNKVFGLRHKKLYPLYPLRKNWKNFQNTTYTPQGSYTLHMSVPDPSKKSLTISGYKVI